MTTPTTAKAKGETAKTKDEATGMQAFLNQMDASKQKQQLHDRLKSATSGRQLGSDYMDVNDSGDDGTGAYASGGDDDEASGSYEDGSDEESIDRALRKRRKHDESEEEELPPPKYYYALSAKYHIEPSDLFEAFRSHLLMMLCIANQEVSDRMREIADEWETTDAKSLKAFFIKHFKIDEQKNLIELVEFVTALVSRTPDRDVLEKENWVDLMTADHRLPVPLKVDKDHFDMVIDFFREGSLHGMPSDVIDNVFSLKNIWLSKKKTQRSFWLALKNRFQLHFLAQLLFDIT